MSSEYVSQGEIPLNTYQITALADQIKNTSSCTALQQIIEQAINSVTSLISGIIQTQLDILADFFPILNIPGPNPFAIVKWIRKLVFGTAVTQYLAYIQYAIQLIDLSAALSSLITAIQEAISLSGCIITASVQTLIDDLDIINAGVAVALIRVSEKSVSLQNVVGAALTLTTFNTSNATAFKSSVTTNLPQFKTDSATFMATAVTPDTIPIVGQVLTANTTGDPYWSPAVGPVSGQQVLASNSANLYWSPATAGGQQLLTSNSTSLYWSPATSPTAGQFLASNGSDLYWSNAFATSSVTNTFTVGTASYFVANGNLGIGTASPTAKLQIVGSAANDTAAELKITGSSGFIDFHNSLGAGHFNSIVSEGDKAIIFSNGTSNTGSLVIAPWFTGTSGIKITNNGSVGIGTSTPSVALELGAAGEVRSVDGAVQTFLQSSSGGYGGFIGTRSNHALTIRTNNSDKVYVGANGNVGIGNVSPDATLVVTGTANISGIVTLSNTLNVTGLATISANAGAASATFAGGNTLLRLSGNSSGFSEPAMEFGELALSPTAKIASKNEAEGGGSLYFITRAASLGSALTTRMRISGTGTLTLSNTYGITVTTPRNLFIDSGGNVGGISSTRSTKININPIDDVNWIYQFEPVTFNYRCRDEEGNLTDNPEPELMYGLIAEDVEPINDDFCIYVDGKLSGVHYDRLISPLIQAVKDLKKITIEQQTIIDSLINRIEVLEANR